MTSVTPMASVRRFCLRTFAMASKEILHIRRDLRTLFLALGMPVVLLMLFGYGVRFDIDHLPLAVADADHTQSSRNLVTALVASNDFTRIVTLEAPEDAERAFRAGEVAAALVIPSGFEQAIETKEKVQLQLLVDGSDAVVANQVLTKAESMVRVHSRSLLSLRLQKVEPPVGVDVWTRFNPTGSSAVYMVPGLAA
jgi:ABC-2 type transport system permease protein